nr:unnamed protein product [Naegleria fowleri]
MSKQLSSLHHHHKHHYDPLLMRNTNNKTTTNSATTTTTATALNKTTPSSQNSHHPSKSDRGGGGGGGGSGGRERGMIHFLSDSFSHRRSELNPKISSTTTTTTTRIEPSSSSSSSSAKNSHKDEDTSSFTSFKSYAEMAQLEMHEKVENHPLWDLLCEDVWCEILSFLESKFVVLNCMTVSKQYMRVCLKVNLKLRIINPKKPRHVLMKRLASSPYMKNLTELTCDRISKYDAYDERSIRPILSSNYLTNLKSLSIIAARISNLLDLLTHPKVKILSNLTQLNLRSNQLNNFHSEQLANCSHFKNLQILNLSHNVLRCEGVQPIVESPFLSNLTHLNLKNNKIGNAGIHSIAESTHLLNLKTLNIAYNEIGHEGFHALMNSSNISNLTYLNVSYSLLDKESLTCLIKASCSTANKLSKLTLSIWNNYEQIRDTCEPFPNLTELKLKNVVDISHHFSTFQFFNHLTSLTICFANLTTEHVKQLVMMKNSFSSLSRLLTLNLSHNQIGNDGFKSIAISPSMKNLTHLNLSYNQLDESCAMKCIQHLKNLTVLNLNDNKLGDEGCLKLTQVGHTKLRWLGLSFNQVSDKGALALVVSSQSNLPNLSFIDMDCIYMTSDTRELLQQRFNFDSKALHRYGINQERTNNNKNEKERSMKFKSTKLLK